MTKHLSQPPGCADSRANRIPSSLVALLLLVCAVAHAGPMRYELTLLPNVASEGEYGWDHPIINTAPCTACHQSGSNVVYTPSGTITQGGQASRFLRNPLTLRFYGDSRHVGQFLPNSAFGGISNTGSSSGHYLAVGRATVTVPLANVAPLTGAAAVSAGGSHSCALNSAGAALCWGSNAYGQLGNNSTIDSATPVPVSGLSSGVVGISVGGIHSCAVTNAGVVQCWGDNDYGELGNSLGVASSLPLAVSGIPGAASAVTAGSWHTCALTSAGAVLCWGDNTFGQLGDNLPYGSQVPMPVSGLSSGVVAVAAGDRHTCALTSAGAVMCWGYNADGELGNNSTTNSIVPVPVSGLASGVVAIATGAVHSCAVTNVGAVQCWGDNRAGELANSSGTNALVPVAVNGLSGPVVGIAAGNFYTCALTSAGAVQCWGYNTFGQLGNGANASSPVPAPVTGLSGGAVAISAGSWHSCALTSGGNVQCWGDNSSGQLGNRSVSSGTGPVTLTGYVPATVLAPVSETGAVYSGAFDAGAGMFVSIDGPHHSAGIGSGWPNVVSTYPAGLLSDNLTWPNGVGNAGASSPLDTYDLTTALASNTGHVVADAYFPGTWPASTNPGLKLVGGASLVIDPTSPASVAALVEGEGSSGTFAAEALVPATAISAAGGSSSPGSAATLWLEGSVTLGAGGSAFASATDDVVIGFGPYTAVIPAGSFQQNGSTFGFAGNLNGAAVQASLQATSATAYDYSISIRNADLSGLPTPVPVDLYVGNNAASTLSTTPSIIAGASHSCAVTSSGGAQCWGANAAGQLGNGSTIGSPVPVPVSGLTGAVAALAGGAQHSCALTTGGAVWCWGYNGDGELGNNSTANASAAVPVTGLSSDVIALAAGSSHTCAVSSGGAVQCWGANGVGELGNGSTTSSPVPVPVSGLASGAIAISAGNQYTCALAVGGTVQCWGSNAHGQLGNNTFTDSAVPVPVGGLSGTAIALAAGQFHACALIAGGTVQCWGDNTYGQLGNGSTSGSALPVAVVGLSGGVVALATGQFHTCALIANGAVQCWGDNVDGALGNNSTANALVPVSVSGLSGGMVAIAAGALHTCALTSNGEVQCWGAGASGQLGNNALLNAQVPVAVTGLSSGTLAQTISLAAVAPRARGQSFPLQAASTSGLAVSLTSLTQAVCTVSGAVVSLVQGGTCTIAASQAGNSVFTPAPGVSMTFKVRGARGDLNADGISDLLWANTSGAATLWLMQDAATPLATAAFGPYAGWTLKSDDSDFNGDGKADLVWTQGSGAVSLWLMNGVGMTSQALFGPYAGWTLVSANADFNGDGRSDLLWWNASTGQAAVWLMNGTAVLSQKVYGPYPGWSVVSGNNDFDGDGKSDLLWTHTSGAAALWLMNGTSIAAQQVFGPFSGWQVVSGAADYDGDGKTDLLWQNTSGAAGVWLMNGSSATATAVFGPYAGWSVVPGARDFNGDGRSDLLWQNTSGAISVWLMNGLNSTATAAYGPYPGWSIVAAAGDFNGDGATDLLWQNTSGAAAVWLMNGTSQRNARVFGPLPGLSILPGGSSP